MVLKKIIKSWVRFGFVVRGFFYIFTGISGFIVSVGLNRSTKDFSQIVTILGNAPFGKALLVVSLFGFIGYGIWGIIRTLRKDKFVTRLGYLVSGISYLTLSFIPLHLILNLSPNSSNSYKTWSHLLINIPYGYIAMIILGLIIIFGGIGQIIYSIQGKFKKTLNKMEAGKKKKALVVTGKFGYTVRGIIFTLIGFFFLQSGLTRNAGNAKDMGEILMWSWQQNGGSVLLGGISLGLVALGVYSVISSKIVNLSNEKN